MVAQDNLVNIPDVPLDASIEQQQFLSAIREVLEQMFGRFADSPLMTQMHIGEYTGTGREQTITTPVRPRLVKIVIHPDSTTGNTNYFERWDTDWGDYSIIHQNTAGNEHQMSKSNITAISDTGFTVSGTNHPNTADTKYSYLIMG